MRIKETTINTFYATIFIYKYNFMIGRFISKYSTLLIIFISAHSNFFKLYKEFFEKGDFEIMRLVILLTLGTISGILWSLFVAGLLWLSVPIYEYFKNGFEQQYFVKDKKYLFQDKIPLLIFVIVVFVFNVITFIVADTTLLSMFVENRDSFESDDESMPLY